jgi:hypothetical protein
LKDYPLDHNDLHMIDSNSTKKAKLCYFVDIPRTLSKDDSLDSRISVLEDIKNGHLVSLMMDPPHRVVFSNERCPRDAMSQDKWRSFSIPNCQSEI